MIYYDANRWTSLLRIHGSVLPRAMLWALPSAMCAYAVEWASQEGHINTDALDVLSQNNIYSGFTYVLGVSLVFRTSQAYSRYWTAATAIHEMASEWCNACASLTAFITSSGAPKKDVNAFQQSLVRLFSLLHAMALSEVARVEDDLPLIDIQGLSAKSLAILTSSHAQGRKVHIVLSWIKCLISKHVALGLLNVPAPMLSHVFSELGAGLVKFHTAQQVVIWPFPFPYTQLNVVLIQIYTVITPLVISTWNTWPIICAVFTFISVTFLVGLNLIASEIENPFGDDPNDLPVLELQKDVNNLLAMQLDPLVQEPPELLASHVSTFKELTSNGFWHNRSLNQRLRRGSSTIGPQLRTALQGTLRRDKLRAQMRWNGNEEATENELVRLRTWLKCKAEHVEETIRRSTKSATASAPASEVCSEEGNMEDAQQSTFELRSSRSCQNSFSERAEGQQSTFERTEGRQSTFERAESPRSAAGFERTEGRQSTFERAESPCSAAGDRAWQEPLTVEAERSWQEPAWQEPGILATGAPLETPTCACASTSCDSYTAGQQPLSVCKDLLGGLHEELSLHLKDLVAGLSSELSEHLSRQLEKFDAITAALEQRAGGDWPDFQDEEEGSDESGPWAARSPPLTQHALLLQQPSRT